MGKLKKIRIFFFGKTKKEKEEFREYMDKNWSKIWDFTEINYLLDEINFILDRSIKQDNLVKKLNKVKNA